MSPCVGLRFRCDYGVRRLVALAFGLFNITATVNGPRQHRPVIAQTVMVETQRHSQVAKQTSAAKKETSAAKDVTPVIATAADTNKSKHHKPKVFARQRDYYGYWNGGVMPKEVSFSADPAHGRYPPLPAKWSVDHLPSTRRQYSSRISSAMLEHSYSGQD